MSDKTVQGVLSTVLLPPKREEWEFISGPHRIDVQLDIMEDGDIVSYDEAEDVSTLVDLGRLTKALFMSKQYPNLEADCVFSIRSLIVDNKAKLVIVVGNIFKKL